MVLATYCFHVFVQQAKSAETPGSNPSPSFESGPTHSFGSHLHNHQTNRAAPVSRGLGRSVTGPEFEEFSKWIAEASKARDALNGVNRIQGVVLAKRRRAALEEIIRNDPESALKDAISGGIRRLLPPEIAMHLEEQVSGRGSLMVRNICPAPGTELTTPKKFCVATVNGKQYQAFIYGRRLEQPSREDVPLHGVAVGDFLALSEDPVRILESDEKEEFKSNITEKICLICNLPSSSHGVETVVDFGGKVTSLCSPEHAKILNDQLSAEEDMTPLGTPVGTLGFQGSGSSWTLGQKKVILIRVDFSDLSGEPFSVSTGSSIIHTVNSVYTEMSYGNTGFALSGAGSDVTSATFRMPQAASWYGTFDFTGNTLRTHARTAAQSAGYSLANYDLDVICLKQVPGWGSWTGQANVGAAGAWVQNSASPLVFVHELGHNYGLNHAGSWNTSGLSVIGPGTRIEYGDIFDIMGLGFQADSRYHFNARYKSYLNWLSADDVAIVTASGTYRIFPEDDPLASGLRGLSIPRNSLTNYWVEFRQGLGENKWLLNGAGLRWAQNGNQRSLLLDSTPGSSDEWNDSALVIGRTFSDSDSGIHITPIAKGNTIPESLDVVVNLGTFATNLSPTISLVADATNTVPGGPLSFQVIATDANGDTLAYDWNFDDGDFGTNGPAASHSWSSVGEYVVRCRVSDLKGGNASDSIIVVVGSPNTYRIRGRIAEAGVPVENVRVFVSGTRMTYTDSEGHYSLVGLAAGSYTVSTSLYGYTFSSFGFSNPVTVGPSVNSFDFLASSITVKLPLIVVQPQSLTAGIGSDVTFSVVTSGTPPLSYQWRFEGSEIPGATNSIYARSNIQLIDDGSYTVVVTNAGGAVTSAVATLVVTGSLAISEQPQNQVVNLSSNATFSVTATGSPPLSYQWYFNNSVFLAGATNSLLNITNVSESDAGYYSVIVSNGASVVSSNALLTVNHVPVPAAPVLERFAFQSAKLRVTDFLGTDPDGDSVTLYSAGPASLHGGQVVTNDGWVVYSPPPGFTNNDSFPFQVTDGRGGFGSGTATVLVVDNDGAPQNLRVELLGDGSVRVIFDGIPGRTYSIEFTEDLETTDWQRLVTATADDNGVFVFDDAPPSGSGQRFYRARWP